MYTNPEILVLDEATSALDGITEKEISSEIVGLKGVKTIVVIAHRLSTIRSADIIYYLEEGRIRASGTFEELRSMNHNFAKQAESMGI
jgi:ABC-type multidrug transport system fused ATPase/permease subunit